MAATLRAGHALPLCDNLWPSMQVIALDESPGILNNMEVVDPPY